MLCLSVRFAKPFYQRGDYGELVQRSYGIWHTKCYSKAFAPSQTELLQLCQAIGIRTAIDGARIDVRIIDETLPDPARLSASLAVQDSGYHSVMLNNRTTFYMRPSRPLVKLVPWQDYQRENCFRLEISCEATDDSVANGNGAPWSY